MPNATKKVKLTRSEILNAHAVWSAISNYFFGDSRATEGVIENLEITEPLDAKIRKTIQKLQDKNINVGEDGKPAVLYALDEKGERLKDEKTGKEKDPIGWDWVEGGQAKFVEEVNEYLEKKEEVSAYVMRISYLNPAWRYVADPATGSSVREDVAVTPRDFRAVKYAMTSSKDDEQSE